MATVLVFHEVDDVEAWLASPRREEIGKQMGLTFRTFVDPAGSNRIGVLVEIPDLDAFFATMAGPASVEPARLDGVRLDTAVALVES